VALGALVCTMYAVRKQIGDFVSHLIVLSEVAPNAVPRTNFGLAVYLAAAAYRSVLRQSAACAPANGYAALCRISLRKGLRDLKRSATAAGYRRSAVDAKRTFGKTPPSARCECGTTRFNVWRRKDYGRSSLCEGSICAISPPPPILTRGHRHRVRRTSWREGIDRTSFRACRSTSSHRWFHPAQSGESPYADDVSTTRFTPPAQRATFPRLVDLLRIQSRCLHLPDRVSRAYLQVD
jgi:hypothetical protein